jgi:hypothetical protein
VRFERRAQHSNSARHCRKQAPHGQCTKPPAVSHLHEIRWVTFDTCPDLLAAIAAEPPFTWRACWLGRESPTIYN